MRIAMVMPGLGRVQRGAETAFLDLAHEFVRVPGTRVTLFGSGTEGAEGLDIRAVPCPPRERFEHWPRFPCLRNENYYEEFFFARNLARSGLYRPADFDIVLGCTYPHLNWFLRKRAAGTGLRVVFVTQNGDWMCRADSREYRWFGCDGLVCVNPSHFEAHRGRYHATLIPNGVNPSVFRPGADAEIEVRGLIEGLPERDHGRIILMAGALIDSKRVAEGVRAAAMVPGSFLVVVGDGPNRAAVAALAGELLPGRHLLGGSVPRGLMPSLYRRAAVFLHMSREEPFGIVYLEASASGLPSVVHDTDITRWILGDSAFFADTSDLGEVAGALSMALERGKAVGEDARRRVAADWSWEAIAARYLDFFGEVLGRPTRRAVLEHSHA